MLGGTTKHYKTYGKHKTNVINKRVVLDNNKRLSPLATSINNKVQPGRWSDSSDDEEVEVVPIVRRKPITLEKKVVPKATMRRSIEMVEQDKENSSPASSTSTVKSAKSKGKVPGVLVLESTEESSDSLKRLPLRRKSAKKVPVRSKFSRVVESEAELSDRPIVEEEEEVAEETSDVVIIEKRITEIFLDDTDEPVPTDDDEVEILSPTIPISTPSLSILPFPSALSPLLKVTLSPDSTAPFDFTSFVSCPLCPFSVPSTVTNPWRKVGEASYSEVFSTVSTAGEEIVIKIIPIASPAQEDEEGREQVEELPFLSEWEAVKREIEISNLLGAEDGGVQGFVPFKGYIPVYPSSCSSVTHDSSPPLQCLHRARCLSSVTSRLLGPLQSCSEAGLRRSDPTFYSAIFPALCPHLTKSCRNGSRELEGTELEGSERDLGASRRAIRCS